MSQSLCSLPVLTFTIWWLCNNFTMSIWYLHVFVWLCFYNFAVQKWQRSSSSLVAALPDKGPRVSIRRANTFFGRNRHSMTTDDVSSLNLPFDFTSLAHDVMLLIRAIMNVEVRSISQPWLYLSFYFPKSIRRRYCGVLGLKMRIVSASVKTPAPMIEVLFWYHLPVWNCP